MRVSYTTQHEQAIFYLVGMIQSGGLREILARYWWYAWLHRMCMREMAAEIESLSALYLAEWRAFRAAWPWETDVLDRMALDTTARVVTVDYIRPQPPPRVSLK